MFIFLFSSVIFVGVDAMTYTCEMSGRNTMELQQCYLLNEAIFQGVRGWGLAYIYMKEVCDIIPQKKTRWI